MLVVQFNRQKEESVQWYLNVEKPKSHLSSQYPFLSRLLNYSNTKNDVIVKTFERLVK